MEIRSCSGSSNEVDHNRASCLEENSEPLTPDARGILVTGIARQHRVAESLAQLEVSPARWLQYGDHHRYSTSDVSRILSAMHDCGATYLITTTKDAIKLQEYSELSGFMYVVDMKADVSEQQYLLDSIIHAIETKHVGINNYRNFKG